MGGKEGKYGALGKEAMPIELHADVATHLLTSSSGV